MTTKNKETEYSCSWNADNLP